MAYAGRHNIYRAAIRKMVTQALDAQEEAFELAHEQDTDEQLLDYLRGCAFKLQHTPWPGEITGGRMIEKRFGTWCRAVLLAKLPEPPPDSKHDVFARIKAEEQRQKAIYRQKKMDKKVRSQQRQKAQAEKKEKMRL